MSEANRDLARIKQQLIERRQELEEQLEKLTSEQISDSKIQDAGDQALSASMERLRSSLQDAELAEYQRIIRALEKIDDGSYGICADCDSHIFEKRLTLYPNASRCLKCQEAFEDKNRPR